MSEQVAVPAQEKAAEVAEPKKSTPKASMNGKPKSTKPTAPKKTDAKKASSSKDRSMSDAPASERRLALVKLLRKHRATSGASAMETSKIAERLGYTAYDVYCLAYHKFPLARDGFVKTARREDSKETLVYLTAKGVKTDPE